MKFLKTMMAAALLSTAIAGNVMAADEYGIEGNKDARKFVLSQNLAQALKDGSLAGGDAMKDKKLAFAKNVFNAIQSKASVSDDDIIAALGKVADNKVEYTVGKTLNLAADWSDKTAAEIVSGLVEQTALELVAKLGLKSPLEATFENVKKDPKLANIIVTVDSTPVKVSDLTLEQAKKATVGKKNTSFVDYFNRDAKYLSKVSKLDKAKEDITKLQHDLSTMVSAGDKKKVDDQLVQVQEELRLANIELAKPKLTADQEKTLNGLKTLEQIIDGELEVKGGDILTKLTELVQQAAQATLYKDELDKLKKAAPSSNTVPQPNPQPQQPPKSTSQPQTQDDEGFPNMADPKNLGNTQGQQGNPFTSKGNSSNPSFGQSAPQFGGKYTPKQEAKIAEYKSEYGFTTDEEAIKAAKENYDWPN